MLSQSNKSSNESRIVVIMEGSRQFKVGNKEFTFDEHEPIYFMKGPTTERVNTQDGCNTCSAKWEQAKDLKDSHCQFCGISNCKTCLKKTRPYRADVQSSQVGRPSMENKRGKCCKLCDRKFLVRDMVLSSTNEIRAQNITIASALRQNKVWQDDIAEAADVHRRKLGQEKH